jgi:hypothetical protein
MQRFSERPSRGGRGTSPTTRVRLGVRDADEVLVDVQTDEKRSRLGYG